MLFFALMIAFLDKRSAAYFMCACIVQVLNHAIKFKQKAYDSMTHALQAQVSVKGLEFAGTLHAKYRRMETSATSDCC